MAQTDTPAKRAACLEFFHTLWKEYHKPGSWLDGSTSPNAGPYGSGSSSHAQQPIMTTPAIRAQQKRREAKRLVREAEILRYWIRSSIACMQPGAFTSDASEGAIAARGVIAASASIRPSLKHITQRIRDADDRGANRLFGPVMTMIESVLKKLFLTSTTIETSGSGDALRSACIKFLEIVVLCCSSKPKDSTRRRGHGQGVSERLIVNSLSTFFLTRFRLF